MDEPADVAATRTAYDIVASDYATLLGKELADKPFDRAVLSLFADLVLREPTAPVGDIGCGPGRIAAHLHSLGLEVFGIDLSPRMIAIARDSYPSVRFEVGSMQHLELPDASLAGVVAWYSIIHTPPQRLPAVFAEFYRVMRSGGVLLLAFQMGDERRRIEHAYGHDVDLDAYRLQPDEVTRVAVAAGFGSEARLTRAPDASEKVEQAFLVLRKKG